MVTLDLADSLFVSEGDALSVSTEFGAAAAESAGQRWGPSASMPAGPDNLVARALATVGRTAQVELVKRIPPGAGLGGGSADAAAILRWAECTDVAVASGLGADIPFCMIGGRATVRGVGEDLTPLPYEERQFTLLLLPFGVDTGAVYRAWDHLAARGELTPGGPTSNDLEPAALAVEPRLARWKAALEAVADRECHLAGSGSTWFIDGSPDETGIGERPALQLGTETGLLVTACTTPPMA